MKYLWILILSFICGGCGGNLWLTPNGHRLFYRSKDGQLSCYNNSCCYPWKEKLMICTSADDYSSGSIVIKYIPEK